jgi:hypothetical protein
MARHVAAWTRALGAAALLGVGLDHLDEFSAGHYSGIPTIGTLFVLNFASATLVAAGLAAPWRRLGNPIGRLAPALLAAGGIAVAAGSLAGLLASEWVGLFGFREVGYRGAILLAIGLDVAAVVLLSAHLAAITVRRTPRAALRLSPGRSA